MKICDFGYSKRPDVEQSQCKSTVGTPAYLAPEVLANKPYKGNLVDIWSCGVLLYVMLVGAYPFEDPSDRCATASKVQWPATDLSSQMLHIVYAQAACTVRLALEYCPWRASSTACTNRTFTTYRTDFQKTVQRILALDYKIPEKLQLSDAVKDLLSKIFVKDPTQRIDIAGIKAHEWYLHRLPYELCDNYQGMERCALADCCM